YDVGGAGTPDFGLAYGATTGQSIVAGVGTNGSGDIAINSGAVSLNAVHSLVMQVEGSTTGNTGTLTLYVDGALASQISGFSLNTMAPASAGTAFGLM